ncbi:MAG: YgjV family protein, partial [Bacilli bacterium]|nr:YgjV family protein [Bacilli bacterium]
GYISLFPTVGSMIRSYCLWQANMKVMRISGITTGLFYGLYYFYYHSWFMVCGDIVLLMVSILAIIKNDMMESEGK